jgi:hypothetical protein
MFDFFMVWLMHGELRVLHYLVGACPKELKQVE